MDFSKKSTPKGGLNTRHVMEVPKCFFMGYESSRRDLTVDETEGGSVTVGRVIAYANLIRKFKNYRESYE